MNTATEIDTLAQDFFETLQACAEGDTNETSWLLQKVRNRANSLHYTADVEFPHDFRARVTHAADTAWNAWQHTNASQPEKAVEALEETREILSKLSDYDFDILKVAYA